MALPRTRGNTHARRKLRSDHALDTRLDVDHRADASFDAVVIEMGQEIQERNAEILAALKRGRTQRDVGDQFGLDATTISHIAIRHGLRRKSRITDDEARSIISQYKSGAPLSVIQCSRDASTVLDVVKKFGIYGGRAQPSNAWKPEDDGTLKSLWGLFPTRVIAEYLGTTKNAVIGRAHRLRLPHYKALRRLPDAS
jgi:hypothetical protein